METEKDDVTETLPFVAAEKATIKAKVKQQLDSQAVLRENIRKADTKVALLRKDITKLDELCDLQREQAARQDEVLNSLIISREYMREKITNLKKHNELRQIEEEQLRKERELVQSRYEIMLQNRKEIRKMNPLVVVRDNLSNECEARRIKLAVLKYKIVEIEKQRKQIKQIRALQWEASKAGIVEFAKEWLKRRDLMRRRAALKKQIHEQQEQYEVVLNKKETRKMSQIRSPRPQCLTLTMPTLNRSPLVIPPLESNKVVGVTKSFLDIFKRNRPTSVPELPSWSKPLPPKKLTLHQKKLRLPTPLKPAPSTKISAHSEETEKDNDVEIITVDVPEETALTNGEPQEETALTDTSKAITSTENGNMFHSPDNRKSAEISPVGSRASPGYASRIPIPVASQSPFTARTVSCRNTPAHSKVPVAKSMPRRDYVANSPKSTATEPRHTEADRLVRSPCMLYQQNKSGDSTRHLKRNYTNDKEAASWNSPRYVVADSHSKSGATTPRRDYVGTPAKSYESEQPASAVTKPSTRIPVVNQKRTDVGSPKCVSKYPRMDYVYTRKKSQSEKSNYFSELTSEIGEDESIWLVQTDSETTRKDSASVAATPSNELPYDCETEMPRELLEELVQKYGEYLPRNDTRELFSIKQQRQRQQKTHENVERKHFNDAEMVETKGSQFSLEKMIENRSIPFSRKVLQELGDVRHVGHDDSALVGYQQNTDNLLAKGAEFVVTPEDQVLSPSFDRLGKAHGNSRRSSSNGSHFGGGFSMIGGLEDDAASNGGFRFNFISDASQPTERSYDFF